MKPFVVDVRPLEACNLAGAKTEEACEGKHKLSLNILDQCRHNVLSLIERVCVRRFWRPCRRQTAGVTNGILSDESSAKSVSEQSAQQRTNVRDCTSTETTLREGCQEPRCINRLVLTQCETGEAECEMLAPEFLVSVQRARLGRPFEVRQIGRFPEIREGDIDLWHAAGLGVDSVEHLLSNCPGLPLADTAL